VDNHQCFGMAPFLVKNCILPSILDVYGVFRYLTKDDSQTFAVVRLQVAFYLEDLCGDITTRPHRH
jgi:hypothetical protein